MVGMGVSADNRNGLDAPILHIDMDSFFVSVERLDNPALCGIPVAVAADEERSVVSSASYEARRFGVRSAMPVALAKRRCPQLKLVDPRGYRYREVSAQVFEIFERFTPHVEKLGIDEGFLDVSGSYRLFGSPLQIARRIRETVREELGLACSVGIAATKFVAKIASVKAKPDGIFVVPKERTLEFLLPLKISEIYGVGPKTFAKLESRAVHTVADLSRLSEQSLQRLLGAAHGTQLYQLARGIDPRPVLAQRDAKSISAEHTFASDVSDYEQLVAQLSRLTKRVAARARAADVFASGVAVTIKTPDFKRFSRAQVLADPLNASKPLLDVVLQLFAQLYHDGDRVRLVGVRLSGLSHARGEQSLWEQPAERWQRVDAVADHLAERMPGVRLTSARDLG